MVCRLVIWFWVWLWLVGWVRFVVWVGKLWLVSCRAVTGVCVGVIVVCYVWFGLFGAIAVLPLIACAVGFVCGGVSVCVGDAGGVCIWLLNCFGCVV